MEASDSESTYSTQQPDHTYILPFKDRHQHDNMQASRERMCRRAAFTHRCSLYGHWASKEFCINDIGFKSFVCFFLSLIDNTVTYLYLHIQITNTINWHGSHDKVRTSMSICLSIKENKLWYQKTLLRVEDDWFLDVEVTCITLPQWHTDWDRWMRHGKSTI